MGQEIKLEDLVLWGVVAAVGAGLIWWLLTRPRPPEEVIGVEIFSPPGTPNPEGPYYVGTRMEFRVTITEPWEYFTAIITDPDGDEALYGVYYPVYPTFLFTPYMAGEHTLTITAHLTDGRELTRTLTFTVRPARI